MPVFVVAESIFKRCTGPCSVRIAAWFTAAMAAAGACLGATTPAAALAPEISVEFNGVRMEFVLIQPGKFVMGSNIHFGDNDESPERTISITRPFYLGKYEVTQRQWKAVMGCNPSRFKGRDRPVETVSWNDALEFLARLEQLTGVNVTFPTEARWEYACRAGAAGPWSFGDSEDEIDDYAWHGMNSGDSTQEVGLKLPNAWGLYDMHGNVGEWCADGYARYSNTTEGEPESVQPPGPGRSPVWRGGAWGDNPYMLRSAYRNTSGADDKHHGIGLRCMILIGEDPT